MVTLTYSALMIRKIFLRYFALPRFSQWKDISDIDPISGRINQFGFLREPWYVRATFWSRWGPQAMIRRVFGLQNPGDGGAEVMPEGFRFEDLGPMRKLGKGVHETNQFAEIARAKVTAHACPFAKSLAS